MAPQRFRILAASVVLVGMAVSLESASAQGNGGGGGANVGNTNVTNTPVAGIEVDAAGVVSMKTVIDRGWAMTRRRIAEARTSLPAEVSRRSELRKISLNRLERAVRAKLERGESPTEEMQFLAGLTRVKHVFFYPETNDIVIAGPAEGWMVDPVGRVRGIESGKPVVELRDLVVALRAFGPDGRDTPVISVSIDPTQEGLAKLQSFLGRLGSQAVPGQTNFIVNGMRESLGLQNITLKGVPSTTHFAQVLVEADYRMKLIGIGLERPRAKVDSYVKLAARSTPSKNAMQRWYFVPNYECVRTSEDKLAMELVGDGVKLVGADELVTREGERVNSATVDKAGRQFVEGFTRNYSDIAKVVPIYAQLRNMIDLAVAAAYIQHEDFFARAGWKMEVFSDEAQYAVQTVHAPARVGTAVGALWKGNRLYTPIGGGVRIQARQALAEENLLADEQNQVKSRYDGISLDHLADGQWWWD